MVNPQGSVTRAASGLVRPTGDWPLPAAGFLVADEYAGRVLRASSSFTLTTLAAGAPPVDDVAESPAGAIYAISVGRGTLLRIGGGAPITVAAHRTSPRGSLWTGRAIPW